MAIAFDAATDSGTIESPTATTHTWTHTVAAGSNLALVVGVSIVDSNAVTSASGLTYNGVALTKSIRRLSTSNNAFATEIWYLVAPATGANSLVLTLGAAPAQTTRAGAVSFTGVDQTTPIEATGGADGNSGQPGGTVTTSTDNAWVLDVIVDGNGDTLVATSPQTARWNIVDASPNRREAGSTQGPKTPAGSVTAAWTGLTGAWCQSLAAIKPAGAAGGITVGEMMAARQYGGDVMFDRTGIEPY